MLKKIITRLLEKRHYWRNAGFDELSELYVSMIFRSVAIGSIGVFVPVYLYRLGYPLADIISVYAWFATTQAAFSYVSAHLVARFGPKHIITASYVMQLLSSLMFLSQSEMRWPLYLLGIVWGLAANLFFVPYHVDFSKVKHSDHSGKEVGFMYIMQKVGLTAGPLLGGVVATAFGARYVFLTACVLLGIGVIPLFKTSETVRTRQHLDFKSFPTRKVLRDLGSYSAFAAEDILTKLLWPAYIGLFILGRDVYAKLGVLSSASVAFSIIMTYAFGKLADRKKGRDMIRISVIANSLLHASRSLVTNFTQTIGINFANDAVTIGYALPFVKGMYSAADDLPGYRIVYLASMEMIGNISRAFVCWMLVILANVSTNRSTLTVGFFVAAIASLLISTEKFNALGKRGL